MKRAKRLLPLLLMVCLLNVPPCSWGEEPTAAERGLEKIKTARNWNCIVLPKEESYLEEWKTLYGRPAWYAPSLFVESLPQMNSGVLNQPSLFEGTEVTVVAEENEMSCFLYRHIDHQLYVGWIKSIRLLEEFPGALSTIGAPVEGNFERLHEVENRWSDKWLPGTTLLYTVLGETVENCVGFTLEYQIIADNTASKWLIYGPRTVWVSDGETWTPLGFFEYPEGGAVRAQVWLPEPMDVAAVATYAHCEAPNLFNYRQVAKNFLIAD